MRNILVYVISIVMLVGSSNLLAGGYDLPTDLVIESDCDIEPTPVPEPINVDIVP